MKGRYLAVIAKSGRERNLAAAMAAEGADRTGLVLAARIGAATIYTDRDVPLIVGPQSRVAVLGSLFRRSGASPLVAAFSDADENKIAASQGAVLITDYWGVYLALSSADSVPGETVILRDPSGSVSCLRADKHDATWLASDAELLIAVGAASPSLDWGRVTRHLVSPVCRTDRTCLSDIGILLPGGRLRFGTGGTARDYVWNPWTFAARHAQISNVHDAEQMLAAKVSQATLALAQHSRRPLVELSGGLDSSIVATCLADRATDVTCVNLYCPGLGGDERRYADAVAARIGATLRVAAIDADLADLESAPEMRSPFPDCNLLQELVDRKLAVEADTAGADSFFSGGGGDNVFCYLSTASPAADRLLSGDGLNGFCRTAADVAALHDCSMWTALGYGLRKALRAGDIHIPRRQLFMTSEALALPCDLHPWLKGPAGALPGKREHVISVAFALWNTDATERSRLAPVHYPLLSQPVVELCLRIPTWTWISRGRNRALARDAFSNVLPALVVNRRTKGDLTGFMAEVFRRQRSRLREMMLEGRLVEERIIDRQAIEDCLREGYDADQMQRGALLTLAKVESWARRWNG